MSKNAYKIIIISFIGILGLWMFGSWISAQNGEKTRYNAIQQMSENRENILDSMWKQIKQSAQIAEKEKSGMKELINSFMSKRGTVNGQGSFFSMLKEQYPQIPEMSYKQIMNIVTGKRDEFQQYQTELKDRCRDYNDFTQTIPNAWFVNARDINKVCSIIGSAHSQNVMGTGQDNDISVF